MGDEMSDFVMATGLGVGARCGPCGQQVGKCTCLTTSAVEVIREQLADMRRRSTECAEAGNMTGAVFLDGRAAGLEFALRALGVEP